MQQIYMYIAVTLFVVSVLISILTTEAALSCPFYCTCDNWKHLRRIICTHKRLENANPGVPLEVEALDVSFNSISHLSERTFERLPHLKYLNMSYNKIHTVQLYTFKGLDNLRILDMSHNHLRDILPEVFLGTPHLSTLLVSHNNFGSIGKPPVLNIPSLKVFSMQECQLNALETRTFEKLISLTDLNLSGNQFVQIEVSMLPPLTQLKALNLSRNPWQCDKNTQKVNILAQENVPNFTPICSTPVKKTSSNKFEKMISAVTNNGFGNSDEIDEPEISEEDLSHIWFGNEDSPESSPSPSPCPSLPEIKMLGGFFSNIPPIWAFALGMEIGAMVAVVGMWVWLRCPCRLNLSQIHLSRERSFRRPQGLRRSLRICSEGSNYIELETIDCPGTPPPPYRDVALRTFVSSGSPG